MAFGKKKNKREVAVKEKMVEITQNPLYPEKQENAAKDIFTALAIAAVCILCVGIITMKFGYGAGNTQAYQENASYEETQQESTGSVEGTGTVEETVVQEEEPVVEEIITGDYVIADSNSRYIDSSELDGLTKEQLSYARNEIYARHGRKFKDEGIQNYFNSKEWYEGTIAPEDFYESMLNDYEIKNAETILSYEKAKGYR